MIQCSSCAQNIGKPEEMLKIETESTTHNFCKSCIKKASIDMSMRIFLNKDERSLLKAMRKFIKHETN